MEHQKYYNADLGRAKEIEVDKFVRQPEESRWTDVGESAVKQKYMEAIKGGICSTLGARRPKKKKKNILLIAIEVAKRV